MGRRHEYDGDDVLDGLMALGIEFEYLNRYEVKVNCLQPDHDDSDPSMHINIGPNAGALKCWSCGHVGHIATYFKDHDYNPFDEDVSLTERTQRSMNRVKLKQKVAKPKTINEFMPGDPWQGDWRGVPEKVLVDHFQARHWVQANKDGRVRNDSDGNPVERILFPVIFRGLYYGYAARYLGKDKTIKDKYFNDPALPSKHLLYPYDLVVPGAPVVIVEGPFDAIRLRVLGYNGLCIFGTHTWSEFKVMEVLRLQPPQIILMFDSDEAGQKATTKVFNSFLRYYPEKNILQFPMLAEHDPGDVPEEYLYRIMGSIPRYPLTA